MSSDEPKSLRVTPEMFGQKTIDVTRKNDDQSNTVTTIEKKIENKNQNNIQQM